MPRKLPDEMSGEELSPLCIVAKMSDAREVENALDKAAIEYTFEITPVVSKSVFSVIFGGIRNGVMFLVRKKELELCRELLAVAGLVHLILK